jgi:hypothetical protein
MSWRGDNRLESNQNRTRHTINASFYPPLLANQIFLAGDPRPTRINRQKNCRQKMPNRASIVFQTTLPNFFAQHFFASLSSSPRPNQDAVT